MNVGEVIRRLSKFDPELPVVMSQTDEPVGCYEVMDIDGREMQRDALFRRDPNAWHDKSFGSRRDDPPAPVVFLGADPPWRPTIDGELAPAEVTDGR